MKLIAKVDHQTVPVEVTRNGDTFTIVIGAKLYTIDARVLSAGTYSLLMDNRVYEAVVLRQKEGRFVHLGGDAVTVALEDFRRYTDRRATAVAASGRRSINAQMPGKVVRLLVGVGDTVALNQELLVLEAMKMQNEIKAPKAGRVSQIAVAPDKTVNAGDLLMVIE